LLGDLEGDLLAECVGIGDGKAGVDSAFDFPCF
jgi:hypothetical protein